jgi:hypothetical protein
MKLLISVVRSKGAIGSLLRCEKKKSPAGTPASGDALTFCLCW